GYVLNRKTKNAKKKPTKPVLDKYLASDGTEIFVGKNNKQNDYLTTKFARRDEIWLHTKDLPGPHVVIRALETAEETFREAA
ncbi:DUF814 domain-containing protein, partial [Bacillus cereus]|nr:DUF814 domain-containing protein [Bacillus cereus]